MVTNHFAVLDISAEPIKYGFIITCVTDVPCHLWFRWSIQEPRKHKRAVIIRGLAVPEDVYLCFDVYQDNEQEEAGDTLQHTFTKINWLYCTTRWFYFWGTVAGGSSPSETCLFHLHCSHTDLQRRPIMSSDDCQRGTWRGDPYFGIEYGYISAGWHDWAYTQLGGGLVFRNMVLPSQATVYKAYLKFRAYMTSSFTGCRTRIRGEADPYPLTFSTLANYDARPRTAAFVNWDDIEPWNIGNDYFSPDITPVIQEIIWQEWYRKGNPLCLFWDDYDDRSTHLGFRARWASSYDSAPATAPELVVLYDPKSGVPVS